MKDRKSMFVLAIALLLCLASIPVGLTAKDGPTAYEVKITNLTRGSILAPILVASHLPGLRLFMLGTAASSELEMLAELGDPSSLQTAIQSYVYESTIVGPIPYGPNNTVTAMVATSGQYDHISVASMLVPTNDAFFAVNGVAGPTGNESIVIYSPAYDAGTEENDEVCDSPTNGGPCGIGPSIGEGYVHIHAGMHGVGTLDPAEVDWRNPVAMIEIRRIPSGNAP